MTETMEQLRRRLAIQEARRDNAPTPEEIAERAAAVRRGWCDENGVLCVDKRDDDIEYVRTPTSGIRQYRDPSVR